MKNFRISEFVAWTDSSTMASSASHSLIPELPSLIIKITSFRILLFDKIYFP